MGEKMKDRMYTVKSCHEVQGRHGNWNYDAYQLGLYNGIELALATWENREPKYKEPPRDGFLRTQREHSEIISDVMRMVGLNDE